jgi:hypothetical protein
MKHGDTIKITWNDGLSEQGIYVRDERGYMIIRIAPSKELACLPGSLAAIEVIGD